MVRSMHLLTVARERHAATGATTWQRRMASGYKRLQIIDMTFEISCICSTTLQEPSDCNMGNEPFVTQGLLHIPQNLPPTFRHRVHETTPSVPSCSQIYPVHAPHYTSLSSRLILSSHLRLGFPSGLFPSGFPNKILYAPLLPLHVPHAPV